MQKITPFLWFDQQAEEAVKFYTSIFKNSRIQKTAYYPASAAEASGMPRGSVMTVEFQLEGQDFTALNGGPVFKFSPAISLVVNCETQAEIDTLWDKLSADGGGIEQCGWLHDKYGVSWQIVPSTLAKMAVDADPNRIERVMAALMKMKKIDLAGLQKAYDGK